eukprot:CAMPEP_0198155222 /NCGR_PEP_ID=MMETSP1443-20131203/69023_1 /TAXON_ID=186043 /ORGANISM="Entomoneis sp., Strain CCMP2396" /LENGTH=82 /DNA_ID=CAMNT_0043821963 /DNA_START=2200 /DNA_END=2448 /DNA_ORIENTATION=-
MTLQGESPDSINDTMYPLCPMDQLVTTLDSRKSLISVVKKWAMDREAALTTNEHDNSTDNGTGTFTDNHDWYAQFFGILECG